MLVVNAGSSSVKLRVVQPDDRISAKADLGPPGPDLADRLSDFIDGVGPLDVVGHRVVAGGARFQDAVILDEAARRDLDALSELAPLHNPRALAAIDALSGLRPDLVSVACFDTVFHAGMPAEATTYPLPAAWTTGWAIRRYGAHGLSCAWAVRRTAQLMGWAPDTGRIVVCHLGSGASVTAALDGRSVDTTMGLTPLEGLVMATRPGDLDPGVVIWLLRHGIGVDEIEDALEHRSGLAAMVPGSGGDMQTVVDRRDGGDVAATLAVKVYVHRLRAKIAGMAAAMQGLDALVFTGGVGENSPVIRAEVGAGLAWLGVRLDEGANAAAAGEDTEVGVRDAPVRTLVVHAREELTVAADCRRLLAARPPAAPA